MAITNGITLTEAREIVRGQALRASDVRYDDVAIDYAIKTVAQKALRETRADVETTNFTLVSGTSTFNFTTAQTTFSSNQFIQAWINNDVVRKVDYEAVSALQADSSYSGQPNMVGFISHTEALLYPTPDSAYTMRVRWWKPLVSWTAGTSDADNVTLNIPGTWVREMLWFGASALLVSHDPDDITKSTSWMNFLNLLRDVRGTDDANQGYSIPNDLDYI